MLTIALLGMAIAAFAIAVQGGVTTEPRAKIDAATTTTTHGGSIKTVPSHNAVAVETAIAVTLVAIQLGRALW